MSQIHYNCWGSRIMLKPGKWNINQIPIQQSYSSSCHCFTVKPGWKQHAKSEVEHRCSTNLATLSCPIRTDAILNMFTTLKVSDCATGLETLKVRNQIIQRRRAPLVQNACTNCRVKKVWYTISQLSSSDSCPLERVISMDENASPGSSVHEADAHPLTCCS